MRGLVVWSLALAVVLSTGAAAQIYSPEAPNEEALQSYIGSLEVGYPLMRDFQGGGARALGMGGAFVAVSDDATAVSWNPAGLFQKDQPFEQPVMVISWRSFGNKAEFTNHGAIAMGSVDPFEVSNRFNDIDFASMLAPLRVKGHQFVLSGAYSRLGEEAYSSAVSILDSMYYWRAGESQVGDKADSLEGVLMPWNYDFQADYHASVNALNIGFGTRLYDNFSLGMAVNAYQGVATYEGGQLIRETGLVVRAFGTQRGNASFTRDFVDSTHFSGIFFTLGLQYAGEKLRAGLTFKTPHTLKQERDLVTDASTYINGIQQSNEIIYLDNRLVEVDMPFVLQLGGAYKVKPNFLVSAELEYRNSSGNMINRRDSLRLVPGRDDTEFFTEIDPHWNNVIGIRTGGEYVVNTGWVVVPSAALRGGFGWTRIPQSNIDGAAYNATTDEVEFETSSASKTRLSAGVGARWPQIQLDLAFFHESLDLLDDTFITFYQAGNSQSVKNNTFVMTFTGYF